MEILPDCDRRTAAARKVTAIAKDWAGEFRLGDMTPGQLMTLRRAATLALYVEECEAAWISYGEKLPSSYFTSVRLLEQLMSRLDRQRNFGALAA